MGSMLKSTFKRGFLSKWYLVAIISTVIMCFVCGADYMDAGSGSVYIIDLILNLGLFKKTLVFFAALPFAMVFCQDYNSGYIKSLVIRSGERRYIFSNFVVCFVMGFMSVFIGIMIFFGIISFSHPIAAYGSSGIYEELALNSPVLFTLVQVSGFSVYGAMWTVAGLALSSILPDKYIALGSPLILGYLLEELTIDFPGCLNLHRLSHSMKIWDTSPFINYVYTIGVFVVISILFGFLFSHFVKRRIRNEMV